MPPVILTSPVLVAEGISHGWPTRAGGVSEGARASLNLGYRWGDAAANVDENRRRVAESAGYDGDRLIVTEHVHGTDVWRVEGPKPASGSYDGLVTTTPGDVLAAFAADCIPMLFADPVARVVGAAHAGWRGTVGGIAARVVETMVAAGARAPDIRVALGPSIGPCCFEVGPEVVAEFRAALPDDRSVVVPGPNKDHIDLRAATRAFLAGAGVTADHVDAAPPCTRCNPDRFFSYRRDGREGGVHMGFITLQE